MLPSFNWDAAADVAPKRMTSLSVAPTLMTHRLKRGLSFLNNSSLPVTCPSRGSCTSSLINDALQVSSLRGNSGIPDDVAMISNPHLSVKRSVHFDLSRNTSHQQVGLGFISEGERLAAWYTREEYKAMIVNVRKAVNACHESQKEWVDDMVRRVISPCNQSQSNRLDEMELQSAVHSMRSDYRGMEAGMVPLLCVMREKHKAKVLDYMKAVPSTLPQDLRERMVAARSLQFSRPHKLYAEVAGFADALFAKDS
jgi:hypothetical protein